MMNRKPLSAWLLVSVFLCFGSTLFAKPHTPAAGSMERRAILDALRVPAQKSAKQPIVFYAVSLRVENGWAYVTCISKDKTGKKYPLGELNTEGLLRKIKGHWKVLHWGVAGDTGLACDAAKKYPQAPRAIFGKSLSAC